MQAELVGGVQFTQVFGIGSEPLTLASTRRDSRIGMRNPEDEG